MSNINIGGWCDPQFAEVQTVLEQLLAHPGERGASVAIYRQGELKVNLWGGTRDKKRTQPWQEDTLVNIFSSSKGVSALAIQKAVDMGLLDLSRRVAHYWPEYGVEGKKDTLVAWTLNHRAAQPALKTPLPDEALFDWERMTSTLAKESPWWEPGSRHGYHMVSGGWLFGEVFRRAVGVTIGQFLREEVTGPLGLDLHLGMSDTDLARIADLSGSSERPPSGRLCMLDIVAVEPDSMTAKALTNPISLTNSSNSLQWRKMELPSANIHATAAALASLYGKAACREGLISAAALARCQHEESAGDDPVLRTHSRFGPGFMLQQVGDLEMGFGPGLQAFGHAGAGGSMAFADPEQELGFAFVMNQMWTYAMMDPRPRTLLDAMYRCLNKR